MKKIVPMIVSALALLSSQAQADFIGFQVGASSWNPDYSGTMANGTGLNIENDLGFTDDSLSMIWLKLEHPVPMVPNVRFSSNDLDAAASSTLTRDITYNGQAFTTGTDITSQFDMTNTELTMYYELLDNWVNFDLGITLRQYDGKASINDTVGTIDFSLPLLYAEARFDLPFTGFFVDSSLNSLSISGNSITETMVALGYESEIGLGARLGVRTLDLQFDESNLNVDLEFEGAYLDLFYHF
ncbi:MAG: TIGR04219 family outer membrane beta-barrel protein [Gammaproteobacteria bacterium]|nr:TIGR04219 family outer membrane beta-barrel protein [Gammaproteobacteria bacterium]